MLASGWVGHLVDRVLKDQPEGDTLGMGLWLVTPLATVLVLRWLAGDGWKDSGFHPRLKRNWKWYVTALLPYPLVTAIVLVIGASAGWIDLSGLRTAPSYVSVALGLLAGQFIKNIFEESVWRGYLTAKLVQLKLKDRYIYIIGGFIWGAWHIPYYAFFLPDADLYRVLPVDKLTFIVVAIATMIGWSIMFAELFRITGTIWPCVLLHAMEDAIINPLVIDGYITIARGMEWLVSPISGLLTTLMYVGIGLFLRARRLRQPGA